MEYRLALVGVVVLLVIVTLLSNPGFFPFLRDALGMAPAATSTPLPTYTALPPLPTNTPYPTYTPLPTSTATNTPTATPTFTSTPTPTFSPTATSTPTSTRTDTPTPTNTNTHTSTPTHTPIPPRTILTGIRALGRLVTIQQELALVDLDVLNPASRACAYSAKHVAKGVIEAGIDLTAIGEGNIRYQFLGHSYTVTAPKPVISSCRVEYIRQYDQRGGGTAFCFHNNWQEMRDIGEALAMEHFVQEALESGILEKAERQSKLVLGNFINRLTGANANIEYEDRTTDPAIPDSCQLDVPSGWEQDYEGAWKREN